MRTRRGELERRQRMLTAASPPPDRAALSLTLGRSSGERKRLQSGMRVEWVCVDVVAVVVVEVMLSLRSSLRVHPFSCSDASLSLSSSCRSILPPTPPSKPGHEPFRRWTLCFLVRRQSGNYAVEPAPCLLANLSNFLLLPLSCLLTLPPLQLSLLPTCLPPLQKFIRSTTTTADGVEERRRVILSRYP